MLPPKLAGRYASGMSDRSDVIGRAVAAYRTLSELAETVEEEWQYVTDLVTAYEPSLRALEDGAPLEFEAVVAVDEAIEEIGLVTDPHKAIDWLSTYPHVIALAVGGDVDATAEPAEASDWAAEPSGGGDADDDNPFRALMRDRP